MIGGNILFLICNFYKISLQTFTFKNIYGSSFFLVENRKADDWHWYLSLNSLFDSYFFLFHFLPFSISLPEDSRTLVIICCKYNDESRMVWHIIVLAGPPLWYYLLYGNIHAYICNFCFFIFNLLSFHCHHNSNKKPFGYSIGTSLSEQIDTWFHNIKAVLKHLMYINGFFKWPHTSS